MIIHFIIDNNMRLELLYLKFFDKILLLKQNMYDKKHYTFLLISLITKYCIAFCCLSLHLHLFLEWSYCVLQVSQCRTFCFLCLIFLASNAIYFWCLRKLILFMHKLKINNNKAIVTVLLIVQGFSTHTKVLNNLLIIFRLLLHE